MRSRAHVAVSAGLLLGLLIIGSTAVLPHQQGTTMYSFHFDISPFPSTNSSAPASNLSASAGEYASNYSNSAATLSSSGGLHERPIASQIASVEKQPPLQSVTVLLPILVAVLLGAILYRITAVKSDEEPPTAR